MESTETSSDRSYRDTFDVSNGYKVRVYESYRGDEAICFGSIVQPVDPSFTLSADSTDQAADWIRTNVLLSRLLSSRIYQICPMMGNPESIRSVAVYADGSFLRVFLDRVSGQYGKLRRIRDLESSYSAVADRSTTGAISRAV